MKFDLLTGGQEIKLAILVKFRPLQPLFCLFSSYFFAPITFGDGLDSKVSLKQAPAKIMKTRYISWDSDPLEAQLPTMKILFFSLFLFLFHKYNLLKVNS